MSGVGHKIAPQSGEVPKSLTDAASSSWIRGIVSVINRMMVGRLNNVIQNISLTANSTTTVVTDARIAVDSAILFQPLTANAATALLSTPYAYMLVTSQNNGTLTLTHQNNPQTDRTFNLIIMG